MRRLALVTGAVLVVASLAVTALLVSGSPRAPRSPAAEGTAPASPPSVDPAARVLLERAAAAAATTAYHGVQFVSAWTSTGTTSEVVTVDHDPGRGTTVRSDGTVRSPARTARVHTEGVRVLPAGGAVGLLAEHYSLARGGAEVVAGREVEVVVARRPGAPAGRGEAARFWIDRDSGLVLRREVYDRRGRTTRASAFVEVTVGRSAGSSGQAATAWPTTLDEASLQRLRANGWHCPERLPGPLALVDARRGGADRGDSDIVHLSYSDGIASVSVFEQRGRLDEAGLAGHRRVVRDGRVVWVHGQVPRRVVWSAGGRVYTVVADAPERTVDAVVAALPHRGDQDGALGRLGRGLDRVASWFNPAG